MEGHDTRPLQEMLGFSKREALGDARERWGLGRDFMGLGFRFKALHDHLVTFHFGCGVCNSGT